MEVGQAEVAAPSFDSAPPTPEIGGYLDALDGRMVEGWVYDKSNPDHILSVEILVDGGVIATVPANVFRSDLETAGIGHGDHCFRYLLPLELFDGCSHELVVRVKDTNFFLPNGPLRLESDTLPAELAFPTHRPIPNLQPLGDTQFAMLRSMQTLTEALEAQSRALAFLVDHAVRSTGGPAATRNLRPGFAAADQTYGPLYFEALNAARGEHDFIFFSIIDWGFRHQRPQHLAEALAAAGGRVFYLSVDFREPSEAGETFRVLSQPTKGVFEIALCCRSPRPRLYEGFTASQVTAINEAVAALNLSMGFKSPVALVQFPSWYPVAVSIPGATLIYDCLDHVTGFSNVPPKIVELEDQLVTRSDAVIVTSEYLAESVGRVRSPVMIRNAAEADYFTVRPRDVYEPANRPVIGYYGAIADWFDIELVAECARRRPEWRFVFIGNVHGCDTSITANLNNVEFLGEQPYDELTHYLYAFDVCIIPFKLVELIKATNPVKVYEYLCAGKPVVATPMPELALLPEGLVDLAAGADEFEQAIARNLSDDDADRAHRRRAWASQETWDSRGRALTTLVENLYPRVSVVVLAHNKWQFTNACLSSVLANSDYPNLEIIVVDNGSTDETEREMRKLLKREPQIQYIRNEENLGFSAGNNVGLQVATGAIKIILNNDTFVTRGWVRDLIRPLLLDPEVGMAGPLTNAIGNEQKIKINYANMEEMAAASASFTASRRRQVYEARNLAFFCVAIRSDVFEKIGLLDEAFGIGFFEDDDYCMRALEAGYRLVICDDVFVHHHLSASFNELGGDRKAEQMKRNKAIFEAKWGQWTPHRYRDEEGFG